jgi:GTP-binding protein
MKIKKSEIFKTVFNKGQLVSDDRAKIIVMGRSNVGKSSLINKILHRKKLAKSSSKPGKTISINYYLINDEFQLVDLPGYGYAKISKSEKRRVEILFSDFFNSVSNVKLVLLLIDSRRGFLDSDIENLTKILEKEYKILTILTKSDKIRKSDLQKQLDSLKKDFGLVAVPFSIKNDSGMEKILTILEEALKE